MKRIHVGIDLHKQYMQLAALDEDSGKVIEEKIANKEEELRRFMARFKGRSIKAVVESGYGWYWVVEALQWMGHEMVLSNPVQPSPRVPAA